MNLQEDIRYLKGVGERRAALFAKLGVKTVGGLVNFTPRSYIDLSAPVPIQQAGAAAICAVRGVVGSIGTEQRIRKGLSVFKVLVFDSTGDLHITFFNNKYLVSSLKVGQEYLFYGRVEGGLLKKEMASPMVFPGTSDGLVPVYPLTAGLNSRFISTCVQAVLAACEEFPETLPEEIRSSCGLAARDYALRSLHFPKDQEMVRLARERLIFEELFTLSLAMAQLKAGRGSVRIRPMQAVPPKEFYAGLPFSPTKAQQRAIVESFMDLCGHIPMNRLIQGDVGSGKTLVAAACAWLAAQNGAQAAMMAPTEILAEQHLRTMERLLEGHGVRIALLTGSMTAAKKRAVKQALADGEIDLLIGTHAIITEDVAFHDLKLVITDEQHRFGVGQRLALSQKGADPHTLVMSATPIPRTLSLIIYGELDVSVIDELPPGRSPVETYRIGSDKRARALGFVKKHLESGKQAYIVCPLIEQDEEAESDLTTAKEYAAELQSGALSGFTVGLVHGRLPAREKERVMQQFSCGEIQALVSTTVIEVGVDVPNAVIMMVENAERFGLSQLHQLRGRVGRGQDKSYCILVSDAKSEETRNRLGILCDTTDGFRIAEEDLRLRGPGDFFGRRQHGLPELRHANFAENMKELSLAQQAAERLLQADPKLSRHPQIKAEVYKLLESVGEHPN